MLTRGALLILAMIGGLIGLAGCTTSQVRSPEPPKWRFESVEELVGRLPASASSNWSGPEVLLRQNHVGLLEYTGGSGAGAATHETAMQMARMEAEKSLQIVDRTRLQEVETELKLKNAGYEKMSEQDRAKSVGDLVRADYFLVGNVGEFGSSTQSVALRAKFLSGELERYRQDFNKFKSDLDAERRDLDSVSEHLTPVMLSNTEAKRLRLESMARETKTPEAWEEDIAGKSHPDTAQLSKVTMNARLIDLQTGRAIWFFNGEASGIGSTETMRSLVGKMLTELTKKTAA